MQLPDLTRKKTRVLGLAGVLATDRVLAMTDRQKETAFIVDWQ